MRPCALVPRDIPREVARLQKSEQIEYLERWGLKWPPDFPLQKLVPLCPGRGVSMELRGPEGGTHRHLCSTHAAQYCGLKCSDGHHSGHCADRGHRGPAGPLSPFVKPLELSQDPEPKV